MQVLVVGVGAIGGYFGGRLAAAGSDVTFLVRPRRAAQLAKDRLQVRSPCGDVSLRVKTIERAERSFDLIIIACKAYDLAEVMNAIAPAVGTGTLLLPLLNGIRHLNWLDARFPQAQVLGGLCHIGVTLTEAGVIEHFNTLQELTLGARRPEQEAASAAAHRELTRGGFGPVLSPMIMRDLWAKFVFLTSYAGLTCLMRAPIGAIAAGDSGKQIARELLAECAAVAHASGFLPHPEYMVMSETALTDERSNGTSSMLRDVLQGGRTEYEHILGDMAARASASGISTPILRIARAHMQVYETVRAISSK